MFTFTPLHKFHSLIRRLLKRYIITERRFEAILSHSDKAVHKRRPLDETQGSILLRMNLILAAVEQSLSFSGLSIKFRNNDSSVN